MKDIIMCKGIYRWYDVMCGDTISYLRFYP